MTISFAVLAAMTLVGTAAAMTLRRAVHCVLALSLGLVGVAGLYLHLGAQFVGFTQVLVYVGAVAILAVFAIMTMASTEEEESRRVGRISPAMVSGGLGILIAAAVFGLLAWAIACSGFGSWPATAAPALSVQEIGKALMQGFALPLEVMGLLLTAALVGAVIIAMNAKGLAILWWARCCSLSGWRARWRDETRSWY